MLLMVCIISIDMKATWVTLPWAGKLISLVFDVEKAVQCVCNLISNWIMNSLNGLSLCCEVTDFL